VGAIRFAVSTAGNDSIEKTILTIQEIAVEPLHHRRVRHLVWRVAGELNQGMTNGT
jgi:hypothetical protein